MELKTANCIIDMDNKRPFENSNERKGFLKILANHVNKIKQLRQKNKELHKITETQKDIISILAHDVRSPLNSIKNIIELKQTEIIDSNEADKLMDLVNGQLNNTIEMVENIVQWGQLYLQQEGGSFEEFDVYTLVKNIFVSESLRSAGKNNKLINNISENTIINSDKHALEFILRNLISNSDKFTEKGNIGVSLRLDGKLVTLSVTDTGVGMTEEQVAKVMSDEALKSTEGTRNEKGSGLGLLLIKQFVARLGGSINVDSEIGKGTTFNIVLQNG